jgi:threonine dehydrogenase-like Zn-dependent dehydrogenase
VIDAVGVDADSPDEGPEHDAPWQPGSGPTQVAEWAVECVAKAGTVCLIGVYPPTVAEFPIGAAMMKNLTLQMGNCNHRRYIPHLVELTRSGAVDPSDLITQIADTHDVIDAYEAFDQRRSGWLKVALDPVSV